MKVKTLAACFMTAAAVTLCGCEGADFADRAANNAGALPNAAARGSAETGNGEKAEERADKILNIVRNMDGIDDAAVSVNGSTAVISISLTRDLDDKALIALKKLVRQNARRIDPQTKRVAVSNAAETFGDIKGEETPPSIGNDGLFINTAPKF